MTGVTTCIRGTKKMEKDMCFDFFDLKETVVCPELCFFVKQDIVN